VLRDFSCPMDKDDEKLFKQVIGDEREAVECRVMCAWTRGESNHPKNQRPLLSFVATFFSWTKRRSRACL
jgi:hypothetical protein